MYKRQVYNAYDFQFCLGKHVHDIFDVKKIQSKAGGLYDVMNGLFVDFSMKPAPYSETPLAFEHLYRTQKIFEGKKVGARIKSVPDKWKN